MKLFKSKTMIEKERLVHYHPEQKFCSMCEVPINKNSYQANKMCNRCFNMTFDEFSRRKMSKSKTKSRKQDRRYKSFD